MSEENKSALVPRLRFPEFRSTREWEDKPLRALGSFFRGLTYSVNEVSDGGLLVLRSSNIQDGALVLDKDLVFVDKQCPDDIQLRSGDIAICMSNGSKALVGKSAEFRGNYDSQLTVGAFCSIFRPSIEFAKLIFQTPKYSKFVSVAIGGGNINNLKNSDLEEFRHPVPKLQPEQQKIADCLSSLDDLIAAETQKLDALKAHKKSLMQQLFPREGETEPRLRFPEFREAGEWEEKRLQDFATIVRGGSPRPIDEYITNDTDGLNWLKIGDIDKESKFVKSTQEKVISSALSKTRVVNPGDLILSNSMSFGRPFILEIKTCIHDGWIAVSEIDISLYRDYLYYLMMTAGSQIYFANNAAGSGVQNLNADIIKLLPVSYPKKKEQQRIADCLSSLDDLITAQSQKIDALKTHKKGLMQQLFPVLDEART